MTKLHAVAYLILAIGVSAAEPGGFTGVWRLNLQKSRMNDGRPIPFNKSHVISIVQKSGTIQWREHRITAEDALLATFAETTDGVEASLISFGNGKAIDSSRITITFNGKSFEQKFHGSSGPGKDFAGTRKFVLASDGMSMTAAFEANRFGEPVAWSEIWDRF